MATITAVTVSAAAPARLALGEVPAPSPAPGEALIRVAAFSLNRGEVNRAQTAKPGFRPGWDFAGTVAQAAASGAGPAAGARVVGMLPVGAWAEVVAAPVTSLAELPAAVSFAQAATLPIAGLTALFAIEKHPRGILGRNVLVTGASGGTGHVAVQLAVAAGARVVGLVRQEQHAAAVHEAGASEVVVSDDGAEAARFGPYDLILESVGGAVLGNALGMIARRGTCVNFGVSAGAQVSFDASRFFRGGGATLYGLIVFEELEHEAAGIGLARLAQMVATGTLRPLIAVEALWTQVGEVAQQLLDRRYPGKAVLHIPA